VSAQPALLVRPGARFECRGDGLCCSDVHALGPLSADEAARIGGLAPQAIGEHARLGLPVLVPSEGPRCGFFEGDEGCRLHRERGAAFKSAACRRFPFGSMRTPDGIRVTTAHRCPCRTVGIREPVDADEARAALTSGDELRVDGNVHRVPIAPGRRVAFSRYRDWEQRAFAGALGLGIANDDDAVMPALEASD
jgi:Fe-S-cluster containining protein